MAFTNAKTSEHIYPVGTNITALTGLQDIMQSAQISSSKVYFHTFRRIIFKLWYFNIYNLLPDIQYIGQNLIAQALAGDKTLAFTNAKTSEHIYPVGTNIKKILELYLQSLGLL